MNKKSWWCCLGPGGRTEKDWLRLQSLTYIASLYEWVPFQGWRWCSSAWDSLRSSSYWLWQWEAGTVLLSLASVGRHNMWRKAKDAEPQACLLLCMPSNPSRLCHPEPDCSGGFFAFPPIFLQIDSPFPYHTWLLWFLSLFRSLGDICIVFGSQLRLIPVVSVPYPPLQLHLSLTKWHP